MARRYEFYFRVAKTTFYERAALVRKMLFSPLENKIHIFKPPCINNAFKFNEYTGSFYFVNAINPNY